MTLNSLKAALLCSLALFGALAVHAQGLPALTITNLGSFAVRSQTSIINNDPGVNSSYSIVGGGQELWGDFDKGIIGYFQTNGDFDVKVRVDSLQPVHRYAKTGLLVRENLTTTSRMVSLFATPTGPTELPPDQPTGEDTVEFNFRRAAKDGSNNIGLGSPGYPNAWLRLARRGNIIYGLIGHDGTNWIVSGSVDTATWPAGAFKSATYLGIGSSSHDDTRLVASELRQFSPVTQVGPLQIIQQPAPGFGLAGSAVSFSVTVNDPVDARYQWFANDIAIPRGTNATFTTTSLSSTNDATRYKVTVTGPNGAITSNEALLSVVAIDAPENPDILFDFDDGEIPLGARVFGDALVDPIQGYGGTGGLVLTPEANFQSGSFVIDDFNYGDVVDSFTVAFKMKIGPGSTKPSDGVSFSFGTNIPNAVFPAPQQGVGPGLAISFDIYDNGISGAPEAPAIDVFYGVDPAIAPDNLIGNILHKPLPLEQLVTSRYVTVVIHMNPDGRLDLSYDGQVIAYHLQTGFTPVSGARFAFGAYEGGQMAFQAIDDIYIDTTTQTSDAYLSSIQPLGNNVSASPHIQIDLADLATTVDTNSIQLQFNGLPITPNISQSDDLATTMVSYDIPNLLAAFSTNTVAIIWSDSAATTHTNTAIFKVGNYVTLPAAFAAPVGSGDPNDSGFRVRFYQIENDLTASSSFAEDVLAGKKGTNIADLTLANEQNFFVDPSFTTTIDYDVNAGLDGNSTFPGIPGITFSKENFAGEILTFIEFPRVGFYQLGVRSDDGFVLTTGDPSDPLTVGAFEGAREPFDTIFGFVVPQARVYPFRLLYYQASGGAALRFFSVSGSGGQILINDPDQPEALQAFRSLKEGSQVRLSFTRNGDQLIINWNGGGTLQSAEAINGTWSPVQGVVSGYSISIPNQSGSRFFRVIQ